MLFSLHPLRFTFIARESIHFPPGKSSNILRGAFGTIFRRIACVPQCHAARTCHLRATCPYARFFEPSSTGQSPSGLADWPRPFVFRATHLDAQAIFPDVPFHFDINLFDTQSAAVAYLVLTFAQLASEGLGFGRRKVELLTVHQFDAQSQPAALVYEAATSTVIQSILPLELDLTIAPAEPVHQIRVEFLTPTELKIGHQLAAQPDFPILAARIRDRLSTLGQLYGPGPLDIDFKAFANRAAKIAMTHCDIRQINQQRTSTRTGQVHGIGGFAGEACYEGDLTEFMPYLKAAQWTGVGRQTVWGKGAITVSTP